jgi:hypothetical protein
MDGCCIVISQLPAWLMHRGEIQIGIPARKVENTALRAVLTGMEGDKLDDRKGAGRIGGLLVLVSC